MTTKKHPKGYKQYIRASGSDGHNNWYLLDEFPVKGDWACVVDNPFKMVRLTVVWLDPKELKRVKRERLKLENCDE